MWMAHPGAVLCRVSPLRVSPGSPSQTRHPHQCPCLLSYVSLKSTALIDEGLSPSLELLQGPPQELDHVC